MIYINYHADGNDRKAESTLEEVNGRVTIDETDPEVPLNPPIAVENRLLLTLFNSPAVTALVFVL